MQNIFILIFLFLNISCGMSLIPKKDFVLVEGVSTKKHDSTHPEIQPFVGHFEQYGRSELNDPSFRVGNIPLNFGTPSNSSHDGVCLIYSDGTKEIIIRKSWWDNANQMSRKVMVFHELGHCRLGRKHNDETYMVKNTTYKASIMNPVIPNSYDYGMYRDGYIKELYTRSQTSLMTLLGVSP